MPNDQRRTLPAQAGRARRAVVAVVLALVATALTAASAGALVAVPAPDTAPAPAGVPRATQTNVSAWPLLDRFGRWDGTTFVPVTADSVTGGHVVAITHGWAVGWLDEYLALQKGSSTLVHFWDPRFVDPATKAPLSANFVELASDLQAADPGATILMYSWIDQSATVDSAFSASAPERATEVNGHRFATGLDEILAPDFTAAGGVVHLIGHSFGANVATTTALALDRPPRQLTLFDSPEVPLAQFAGAKNDLRYKLTRLDVGRGAGQVFVDNYVSKVGEPYHGYPGLAAVVDVRLTPPSSDTGGEAHEFPIGWYAGSATQSPPAVGYGWSPLAGANVGPLGAEYHQAAVDTPYALTQVDPAPRVGVDDEVAYATTPLTITSGEPITVGVDAGTRVANVAFSTTRDSLWLTYSVTGGNGDVLDVFVDGRQRSTLAFPPAGAGAAGQFVILYDLAPGDHVLSLAETGVHPACAGCAPPVFVSDLAVVSTTHIQRNLTPTQTRDVTIAAVVVVVLVVLAVLALLAWALVRLVRAVRGRRERR